MNLFFLPPVLGWQVKEGKEAGGAVSRMRRAGREGGTDTYDGFFCRQTAGHRFLSHPSIFIGFLPGPHPHDPLQDLDEMLESRENYGGVPLFPRANTATVASKIRTHISHRKRKEERETRRCSLIRCIAARDRAKQGGRTDGCVDG